MSLSMEITERIHLTEEQMAGFIVSATNEVFTTMVMMDPTPDYPLKTPVSHFECSVSGIVGFAGIYSGTISIHCPLPLALKVTGSMLGIDCDEAGDDLDDAIGEVANMLAGSVKQVLSKGGLDIKLSIPTIITGEEYTINTLTGTDCVVVPFTIDGTVLLVGLNLQND